MYFICSIGIPNNEFPILRCRNKMSPVRRPMHSIYFRKMALEIATRFHADSRELFGIGIGYLPNYNEAISSELNDGSQKSATADEKGCGFL